MIKSFNIEPIIDSYLITGHVREDENQSGKAARTTLVDAKNLVFNRLGATIEAVAPVTPPESPMGYLSSLNFQVEYLKNGVVLVAPIGENRAQVKNYYSTVNKLAEALQLIIDENITSTPLK